MRHNIKRILTTLFGTPWLITREALEGIAEIALGEGDIETARLAREEKREALLTLPGAELPGTAGRLIDGVAVLELDGPIYRRADMFQEISGATSLESLARELRAANENPAVRAIVLNINSPGGSVNGVQEFAELIRRNPKPIHAFAGGLCCSAAYWIGSAAKTLTVGRTALVGSIGVISIYVDESEKNEREGRRVYQFRSSQSPRKNLDPASEDGRGAEQLILDGICTAFIESVARFRGVSPAVVAETFGQGGVVLGDESVRLGMTDRLGLLDDLIHDLNSKHPASAKGGQIPHSSTTTEQPTMNQDPKKPDAPDHPSGTGGIDPNSDDAQLYMLEGEDRERKRIRTIFESPAFKGIRSAIGDKYFGMIFDDCASAEKIVWEVMESQERLTADLRDGLREDAAAVDAVGEDPDAEEGDAKARDEALIQAMLAGASERGAA